MAELESVTYERRRTAWNNKTEDEKKKAYEQTLATQRRRRDEYLQSMYVVAKDENGVEKLVDVKEANLKRVTKGARGRTILEYRNIFHFDYECDKKRYESLMNIINKFNVEFEDRTFKNTNIVEITIPELHPEKRKVKLKLQDWQIQLKEDLEIYPDLRDIKEV